MISEGTSVGKYRIDLQIGQGGMGTVFKAFDTERQHDVAIKVLNDDLASSPTYRQMMADEARLSQSVESEFIVKVYDFGEIENLPFMAMEFISGPDLSDESISLDFKASFDLLCLVAEGIQTAHASGLIHRDLKPENIKLTDDGSPRILDFGLAKEFDPEQVDEFGNVEGTLYYLSPEQLSGEPPSPSTDIFSFGIILYEMLSGRRPFEGDYPASIVYSILHEDPIPPSELDESLPVWLDEVTGRLLAKRPQERFQSLAEAVEFMKDCLERGALPSEAEVITRQSVTVIEIQNLSNDESFNYFCQGFTDDVIHEVSRRTDLIVSAEPSTSFRRNVKEIFDECRSKFVMTGSLMLFREQLKLNLSIHTDSGDTVLWSNRYAEAVDNLFDMLANAAKEIAGQLADATRSEIIAVDEEFHPDVTAYDYYLKGKTYYATNKPNDLEFAEQMYTKALEIEPKFALAHAGLANVYSFQYMAYYDRTPAKIQLAFESAQKAIDLDASKPECHRSLARYHMCTGDGQKAEQALLKCIDLDPKFAVGYRTLGWLKHSTGAYEKAHDHARRALELAPTDLETLLLIALINISMKKYTPAMATLQRAIELGPDYGRAHYMLGHVYSKLGVLDMAIENLHEAIKYKGDPNCHLDAGYIHLIKEQYTPARQHFTHSIEEDYFPFVAEYYLGLTDFIENQPGSAQKHFENAIGLMADLELEKPENVQARMYYILSLAGLGRTDETRTHLASVESAQELNGEVLYNLARCYAWIEETDKVDHYLKASIEAVSGPSEKEIEADPHFTVIQKTGK